MLFRFAAASDVHEELRVAVRMALAGPDKEPIIDHCKFRSWLIPAVVENRRRNVDLAAEQLACRAQKRGAAHLREHFHRVQSQFAGKPFREAAVFEKAYFIHLLQDMIEAGTPNVLIRRGITKRSIPIGTEVIVDGFAAKNGTLRGSGRDLTLPDGRKLLISSAEAESK